MVDQIHGLVKDFQETIFNEIKTTTKQRNSCFNKNKVLHLHSLFNGGKARDSMGESVKVTF